MSGISNYILNQKINAILGKTSGLPSVIDLDTTLTTGNNAGANDIDMNNNDILQVNNIDLTTINGGAYPPTIPTPTDINITDDNTSAVFYPTFVSGTGTQPLLADTTTTPFSINPNTGDFNVGTTLKLTQTNVGVGKNAGATSQGLNSTAVGSGAGTTTQGANAVAVGSSAGTTTQGANAVAIGLNAGNSGQGGQSVAVGRQAGQTSQGTNAVAVGYLAGQTSQSTNSVAVGVNAGSSGQLGGAVAVGLQSGQTTQGAFSVAVGINAGNNTQGGSSVAVGVNAGQETQGAGSVAVGPNAGNETQGAFSVAVGQDAGLTNQGPGSVGIGPSAGQTTQGKGCVAVGNASGRTAQENNAVAVGLQAGQTSQGTNAIAIGNLAGNSFQTAGSIALNGSGVALNPAVAGFFVNPIRADATEQLPLQYNSATQEVTTGPSPTPSGAIMSYAGTTAPSGWLICDGSLIVGGDLLYPDLFAVIGYDFGGSLGNFNLPDLTQRVPVGVGGSFARTNTGGSTTHTLTISQMPSHNHGVNDSGHIHNYGVLGVGQVGSGVAIPVNSLSFTQQTASATTGISIQNNGGGSAFNILQPYLVLYYIIKT